MKRCLSLVQINPKTTASNDRLALFDLGFRPFFLGAGVFSVLSIIAWTLVYSFQIPASTGPLSLFEWHAHQMIYGFSMAVIAGFLLTAILKWTNVETLHSNPLKLLFVCWAIPRVALLFGVRFIEVAALFDAMFLLGLCYGVSAPIVAVRQWKQIGILTKLLLLAAGNICFYLDAFNVYSNGAFIGVYGGLLLIISLILTIGGRVMPAFIKNSLTHSVEIRNPFWVTIATLILFLIFSVNILFHDDPCDTWPYGEKYPNSSPGHRGPNQLPNPRCNYSSIWAIGSYRSVPPNHSCFTSVMGTCLCWIYLTGY